MLRNFIITASFLIASAINAQNTQFTPNNDSQFYRNIEVTGFAQKEIEPTYVTITITFSQEDTSTKKAMDTIDVQTTQLVNDLEAVSETIDVTLDRFEIAPTYEGLIWDKFRVSRTLKVKITDFDWLSETIDRIAASQPYWMSNLEFKNDETGAIERDLMTLAAEDARAQAEALVAKVGGKLGTPLVIEFIPQNAIFAAPMAGASDMAYSEMRVSKERMPQLAPSSQTLSTSVRVIYEILPE